MTSRETIISKSTRGFTGALLGVALFSAFVNILMLTGPLFMLQVYDRVLASRSVPTLVALFALVCVLFAFLGFFDWVRARMLSRVGHALDARARMPAFRTFVLRGISTEHPEYKPLGDLAALRNWISSPGPLALFDLPWFPVYLAIVWILHPFLGMLACFGAILVTVVALLNQVITRRPAAEAAAREMEEARFSDQAERNAEAVVAMGMLEHLTARWSGMRDAAAAAGQRGGERGEGLTAFSKSFRLLLQSAILGLGAWLAIQEEISAGMIVTASIIAGRALAPIDQTIGGWRATQRAWLSWKRLKEYLATESADAAQPIQLDAPQGHVTVENATKMPPVPHHSNPNPKPILQDISFTLKPGDGLGVIGPSASGKSTLAKLLVGLWLPDRGAVRIDGATHQQWDPNQIGPHLGYLPQSVELFSGTIADNIARFDPEARDEDIIEAAKLADVHEMILALPDGYATPVDSKVCPLSGGQRQRVALARAVFRKPRILVLDEPNSNLDAQGDAALSRAVQGLRETGSTVIVMAHRPSAIAAVDKVLMLNAGQQVAFGPKAEVLRQVTRPAPVSEAGGGGA